MTIGELIEKLSEMDQDRVVVLSSDAEGNGYSKLREIETGAFMEGEVRLEELTEELRKEGYTEDDLADESATPVVVLWP